MYDGLNGQKQEADPEATAIARQVFHAAVYAKTEIFYASYST